MATTKLQAHSSVAFCKFGPAASGGCAVLLLRWMAGIVECIMGMKRDANPKACGAGYGSIELKAKDWGFA